MATHTLRQTFTLAGTSWLNKTPADFASMGAVPYVPLVTDIIRTVYIEGVAAQAVSLCYGARTGSADDGARGAIGVPLPSDLPAWSTLTFKDQTVELSRDGDGDAGDRIDITGLTRAALRSKITALLTAGNTGVAGLVTVDGPTDDLIICQATAGEADAPQWSVSGVRGAWAAGLAEATAHVLAVGDVPPIKTLAPGERTSVIALRPNVAGAVVKVEIEVESHGSPLYR